MQRILPLGGRVCLSEFQSASQTKDAHDEICKSRNDKTSGHEFLYVAIIGKEAVHKLSYCVSPIKTGTDYTKLSCIQGPLVNDRLLHHIE